MEPETTRPMGRPTKYKREYAQKIIDFFNVPHTKRIVVGKSTIRKENKTIVKYQYKEVPNPLPFFERFAFDIGVDTATLNRWHDRGLPTEENIKKSLESDVKRNRYLLYKEFCGAYKMAKQLQYDMINDLATRGYYSPHYTKFLAMNILGMKERSEVHNTGESQVLITARRITVSDSSKKEAE